MLHVDLVPGGAELLGKGRWVGFTNCHVGTDLDSHQQSRIEFPCPEVPVLFRWPQPCRRVLSSDLRKCHLEPPWLGVFTGLLPLNRTLLW